MGLLLLMGNSFSGALDSLGTGLESAWSVGRRLRAAYTGPVIRVRRSSDNAEQDFYGTGAGGAVSVSAVQAFCGAGDGFLATIYGQAGNSRNLTQSSTTIQPIVCESGVGVTAGGKLAAKFVAATAHRMSVASSTATYKFMHITGGSVLFVAAMNNTAATKRIVNTQTGSPLAGFSIGDNGGNENLSAFAARVSIAGVPTNGSSVSVASTTSILGHHVGAAVFDPDNGTAASRFAGWVNGTAVSTSNTASDAPADENAGFDLTIGTAPNASFPMDGTIQEIVIFSNLIATASRDFYESNAGTFYGITVA